MRLRLFLLLLAIIAATATPAQDRPRIGLVLSGGGARGAAHVGVLKVLEELRVPIDAIAGTSMGAVVGGLYASGLTASEVESIMISQSFQQAFGERPPRSHLSFRRKQEDLNFLVKFPLGLRGGRFLLPKGLIQGQALHEILRRMTAPVATIRDFDQLPTPFRAVATDLVTGEPVVLGAGDLTTAMRASLAAPGVFAPVEWEGQVLVDGGIAANLPIDAARTMDDVDVLIVVDVGFPLLERERLGSAPIISNQMLAILIRRDTRRQRATLEDDDVVIDPPLGNASSFDFNQLERAIELGMQAARGQSARLQPLALSPEAHERYLAARAASRQSRPEIDFLRVEPGSERYAQAIHTRFDAMVGKPFDAEELRDRIRLFYGQGNLETLDYRLIGSEDEYGLLFTARRNSWGPNYVRFGLNLQDDFEGSSSYNAAARFVLAEVTHRGGEVVWDLQIGENPRIATEVYLPLSHGPGVFVMPRAQLAARNLALLDMEQRIAELRVRTFEYGLDTGYEFGNWGEIRGGYGRVSGISRVRVGDPTLPTGEFDADEYFGRFSYDRLDDVDFPRHGQALTLEWAGQSFDAGPVRSSERMRLDWLMARSWGRQTAVLWSSFGTTIDEATTDVRTLFSLGGFLNLSGLQPDSLTGPHFGIVRGLLYRQIGRGGPGVFDVPAYLGVSYEIGNVWGDRADAGWGAARKDGSLFLGLDSLLGPVYLAVGYDETGEEAFYLFLGRTF